jgi:hypothetical protein
MQNAYGFKVTLAVALTGIGLLLPSAARADSLNALVQDVGAYMQDCKPAQASAKTFPQKCYNERAELVLRMHDLHVNADDVNRRMATRGNRPGFAPGQPYP